jgi:nucleoside-diphosphate-sugar epimerase
VVDKGIPLPLASVRNKRSLIYLGNLVDALILCAVHPAAAGKTYLVGDGEDISIAELVRQMALGMGKPERLFPMPTGLLRGVGRLLGRAESVGRIVGSLRVDDSLIRKELGWQPRYTRQQGLEQTVRWYEAMVGVAIP